jgi:hypothetical protein
MLLSRVNNLSLRSSSRQLKAMDSHCWAVDNQTQPQQPALTIIEASTITVLGSQYILYPKPSTPRLTDNEPRCTHEASIAEKLSRIGGVMLGPGIDCFTLINKRQASLTMECSGSFVFEIPQQDLAREQKWILEVLSDVCVICAINALCDSDRDSKNIHNPS